MSSPIRLLVLALCALLGAGCSEPPPVLLVGLLTDLRPGVEFDRVLVEVSPYESTGMEFPTRTALATEVTEEGALRGARIGEFADLERGSWLIVARLLDGDIEVGVGQTAVDLGDISVSATVRVERSCVGVECPGDGNPTATACLGGRCVDPRCSPENPELCPPSDCEQDTECGAAEGAPACAVGLCLAGYCGTWLDDQACASGLCLFEGCADIADAGPPDSGPPDSGPPDSGPPPPCGVDEHVQSGVCIACPPGTSTPAGDEPSGADTSCEAIACAANQRVESNVCTDCAAGTTSDAGDDATGGDTTCEPTLCAANKRVRANSCSPCPAGSTNEVGDDASGGDTECDPTLCAVDQRVVGHACLGCPAGSTNVLGDDASGSDTLCDATVCATNKRVQANRCVGCPAGSTNLAGDDASGGNTACDATLCPANQRVQTNACVACPVGSTNEAGDDATGSATQCEQTCTVRYGGASGFQLCAQSETQCNFFAMMGGNSCADICGAAGGACFGAFNNEDPALCVDDGVNLGCAFAGASSLVCYCSRPPG